MNQSLITEPLGLFGWSHLEPVILAALASESPMLLIGKHGSAKSFILERLAEALGLEFRCYNASLINYDDLVGIPVPVKNNTALDYISHPSAIWDAEVVFIDELNRTKPELQNKLFPIIHEKRVQGMPLNKLRYRWAAMNPPPSEDEEEELSYLGAMPLDPALADRFPFLIQVPTWEALSEEEKQAMLLDNHLGRHEFPVSISKLIEKTKERYQALLTTKEAAFTRYIITLMGLLQNTFGYISARRATILEDTLLYLYAASEVLEGETSFEDVAYLHLQNTLPQVAQRDVDLTVLLGICQQAIRLSAIEDDLEKELLLTGDPIRRLKEVILHKNELSIALINDIIPASLSEIEDEKKRRAMALFAYLAFRTNSKIQAAVMETLAQEVRPILETKTHDSLEFLKNKKIADTATSLLEDSEHPAPCQCYLRNYIYSFLPDGFADGDSVRSHINFFIQTWEELGL